MNGSQHSKSGRHGKHNLKLILAAAVDRSIDEAVQAKLHETEERIVEKVIGILSKRRRNEYHVEPAELHGAPAEERPQFDGLAGP